jgi:hypothetical protein
LWTEALCEVIHNFHDICGKRQKFFSHHQTPGSKRQRTMRAKSS